MVRFHKKTIFFLLTIKNKKKEMENLIEEILHYFADLENQWFIGLVDSDEQLYTWSELTDMLNKGLSSDDLYILKSISTDYQDVQMLGKGDSFLLAWCNTYQNKYCNEIAAIDKLNSQINIQKTQKRELQENVFAASKLNMSLCEYKLHFKEVWALRNAESQRKKLEDKIRTQIDIKCQFVQKIQQRFKKPPIFEYTRNTNEVIVTILLNNEPIATGKGACRKSADEEAINNYKF